MRTASRRVASGDAPEVVAQAAVHDASGLLVAQMDSATILDLPAGSQRGHAELQDALRGHGGPGPLTRRFERVHLSADGPEQLVDLGAVFVLGIAHSR